MTINYRVITVFFTLIILKCQPLMAQSAKDTLNNQRTFEISLELKEKLRHESEERLRHDWAFMKKYKKENDILISLKKQVKVVFIGNSITEAWKQIDSVFFAENDYIDRGIGGQTSPQMLVRFRQDVINLHPKVVVISAGINDIAENMGPISLEEILGNIISMCELAKANKIKVIVTSVLPAFDFPWRHGLDPAEKIVKLNIMIMGYAGKAGLAYANYFPFLADNRNGLRNEYTEDGVHPILPGYRVMEPIIKKMIDSVLKKAN